MMETKKLSCYFDDIPDIAPPPQAILWTANQYCDLAGWYSLPNAKDLELKPTRFKDQRILFLNSQTDIPDEIKGALSGKYDAKIWSKEGCTIAVEGDTAVFIYLPTFKRVTTYHHPTRLPTFPKLWKPVIFIQNDYTASIMLTESVSLLIHSKSATSEINVECVDHNGGFCCTHPNTKLAIAYGSFGKQPEKNIRETLPHFESTGGDWGFKIQFFTWGLLQIPTRLSLKYTGMLGHVNPLKKKPVIARIYHPPNLYVDVKLDCSSKLQRDIDLGKDFSITARMSSSTDFDVYLLMDGQLVKGSLSFDVRLNKEGNPKVHQEIVIMSQIDKEIPDSNKMKLLSSKNCHVVLQQGCPSENIENLVSNELIAVYDAATGQYYTHPPTLKLSSAFTQVATAVKDKNVS